MTIERLDEGTNAVLSVSLEASGAPEGRLEREKADRITDAEAAVLRERAAQVVAELSGAFGSDELQILDSLTAVGAEAQTRAGAELDVLRTRVGEMLADGGSARAVTNDLVDLRMALQQINPAERESLFGTVRRVLPFAGSIVSRLERIAVRYESVSRQVVQIEQRLQDGRTTLRRDNVVLRKLYEDVEVQQLPLERNAYLGEALIDELERLLQETEDPRRRERLETAVLDVTSRIQDLRTMQEVHTQFFVSIEMTRVNNSRLAQAVDRTLSMTTNTLMVGLALQGALARQQRVLLATQRTRQFLGDLMVANAAVVKQHSADIGDVFRNPVVAMEKLTQAHRDLLEAVNIAARVEAEGAQAARANIERLREMTGELSDHAVGGALVGSIEA